MSTRWTPRTVLLSLVATLLIILATFLSATAQEAESGAVDPAAKVEDDFTQPQIILSTQKQPVYPPAAFGARYSGSVLVEMTVLKDGSVGDVEIVECTRPKVGFEEAVTTAVSNWRFEPATKAGEPLEVKTRIKLNFNRVGVGLSAEPQVSAGSFTTEAAANRPASGSSQSFSSASGGGGADPK